MRKVFAIMAAVLLLSACGKEVGGILVPDVTTAAFVRGGTLVDDYGQVFEICENNSGIALEEGERVFAAFDILAKTSGNSYTIILNDAVRPLCKAAVEESDIQGDDPIIIDRGWISGTYLNLSMYLILKHSSATVHRLELVRDRQDGSDTLRLRLRHDAYGDVFDGSQDPSAFVAGTTYASFDLESLVPSGRKEVPVSIRSRRYSDRSGVTDYGSTEVCTIKGKVVL